MEEVWLPDFLYAQSLGSAVLWSCLANFLPWSTGEVEFAVEFGGIWEGESSRTLTIRWDPDAMQPLPHGVPDRTVTEMAACAVALVVCAQFQEARTRTVASIGDGFDYWLRDAQGWLGLEVSGTWSAEPSYLSRRAREKRQQLLGNPYGLNGFVVVVGFALRTIRFSAHVFGEERES